MELTAEKDWKVVMAELKKNLEWGDQRRIADRLDCHPNRVNLALKGFVTDEDFLTKLVAEAQKIVKWRKSFK